MKDKFNDIFEKMESLDEAENIKKKLKNLKKGTKVKISGEINPRTGKSINMLVSDFGKTAEIVRKNKEESGGGKVAYDAKLKNTKGKEVIKIVLDTDIEKIL